MIAIVVGMEVRGDFSHESAAEGFGDGTGGCLALRDIYDPRL